MYLFYLDECGDPNSWINDNNFILAGVAIHEGQVRGLSDKLDAVQERFFPGIRIPMELHAYHMHSGKERFRHMPPDQRIALLDSAYRVIADAHFPNLIAFITAIHVSAVTTPGQALTDCLEDICQRFNTFLVRQFNARHPDKGLLIMDRSGRDARVRELMGQFDREGTRRGYLGNIVDVPYFGDSSHTRMLQLADLLAFAGGRYFNRNDPTHLNTVLSRIGTQYRNGPRVGLKHIVGRDFRCSCIAGH
jgi:hypothetical protein